MCCNMVIGIFGESCTGKSTLAAKLNTSLSADIYTGKDYLRLAKNEGISKKIFQKKLEESMYGTHILYVITEKEDLTLLPAQAVRVLVTADLDRIKERFASRMHGTLPSPVEKMLKKKHGCFDKEHCDIHFVSGVDDVDDVRASIQHMIDTRQ